MLRRRTVLRRQIIRTSSPFDTPCRWRKRPTLARTPPFPTRCIGRSIVPTLDAKILPLSLQQMHTERARGSGRTADDNRWWRRWPSHCCGRERARDHLPLSVIVLATSSTKDCRRRDDATPYVHWNFWGRSGGWLIFRARCLRRGCLSYVIMRAVAMVPSRLNEGIYHF